MMDLSFVSTGVAILMGGITIATIFLKSKPKCDEHGNICTQLAVSKTLIEELKGFRTDTQAFNKEIRDLFSESFTTLRRHERSIGRLEGEVADDDTKGNHIR
jgi:hypothetical protein